MISEVIKSKQKKFKQQKQFEIIDLILAERKSQDDKWGEQDHDLATWCLILGEEVGEVNQAVLENRFDSPKYSIDDVKLELIQVAAVAVSMLESINRQQYKKAQGVVLDQFTKDRL
jgi:NTP pyrophosphatase (non-canonical NTP hydrolase)